jgi:hypothetical protein
MYEGLLYGQYIRRRYVCILFISTVDQPIERVTIQALDCLLAVAPAQAGGGWGGGGDYVVA